MVGTPIPSYFGQVLKTSSLLFIRFLAYTSISGINDVVCLSEPLSTDLDLAVIAPCMLAPATGALTFVPPSGGSCIGRPMLGTLSCRAEPAIIPLSNPDTAERAPEATVLPKPATLTANVPIRSCTVKLKFFQFSNYCARSSAHRS